MSPADKYLQQHADDRSREVGSFPTLPNVRHALAIPCYDEAPDFLTRLATTRFDLRGELLAVIVINEPVGKPSSRNRQLLQRLAAYPPVWQHRSMTLIQPDTPDQKWLVVDCCHPGLPADGGVGTARKIAADLVLALREQNKIQCDWLHCSDADAHLPGNYFCTLDTHHSAAVFDFTHQEHPLDHNITAATRLYEQALHYYVAGLAWAGSPYAFHTIGSTLAVNLRYYPLVRGFPQRAAAEDFYLLNKLAKLAPVQPKAEVQITLESRLSERVPFGTGPAVARIMALPSPHEDYTYYSLESFAALRSWLHSIRQFAAQRTVPQEVDPPMAEALRHLGIDRLLSHLISQNLHGARAVQAVHHWFDAFRTLKALRYLQQHHFPAQPLSHLLQKAPFR